METPSKQLTRVRTFKDDFLRAQEAAGISPSLPTQPTADAAQTVTPPQTEARSDKPVPPTNHSTNTLTRPQPTTTTEAPSFDEIVESDTDTVSPVAPIRPEITVVEAEPVLEETLDTPPSEAEEITVPPIEPVAPSEPEVPTVENQVTAVNDTPVAADTFDPYAVSEVEEGTIITDQKNDDFRIIPALVDMVSDSVMGVVDRWFGQPEVERTTRAETRTDILKKAAARSALAPQDDFGTVAEHKEKSGTGKGLVTPVVQIKDKTTVAAPSWSHVVEQEDSGNAASAVESHEPEAASGYTNWSEAPSAAGKQEETEVPLDTPAESVPTQTAATEADTPAEPVEEFVTPPPPTPLPQPETIAEPEPIAPPEQPEPTPAPQPSADPEPQATRRYAPTPEPAPRNMLVAFGVVIFIATILGVSVSVWLFGGSDSTVATNVTPAITSLVRTEQSVAVPLGDSADELLRNLLAATTQPNLTLTHLYPTVISGGVSRPASSEEILTVLDLRTPGSFTRTVETLSFGLYQDREPYIVMKVTNFDNAFSGTLTWEPFMSSDLSPLFGAPVTGTFNPQSRSATQVENPYFVDTVVANYDTRILRNERQEERLLYSFVNRNMLVITTSREALEQIADSLNRRRA